jgi:hypothetical protein
MAKGSKYPIDFVSSNDLLGLKQAWLVFCSRVE